MGVWRFLLAGAASMTVSQADRWKPVIERISGAATLCDHPGRVPGLARTATPPGLFAIGLQSITFSQPNWNSPVVGSAVPDGFL